MVTIHRREREQELNSLPKEYRSFICETPGDSSESVLFGQELRLYCRLQFCYKPEEMLAEHYYASTLTGQIIK